MQEVLHLDQQIVNRQIHGMEMSIMSEWEVRTFKGEEEEEKRYLFFCENLNEIFTKFESGWSRETGAAKSFVVLHFLFKFFGSVDYIKECFLVF